MPFRVIEVIAPTDRAGRLRRIAEEAGASQVRLAPIRVWPQPLGPLASPEARPVTAPVPDRGPGLAVDPPVGLPHGDGTEPGEATAVTMLVGEIGRQALLDNLQNALEGCRNWRILLHETAAVIPHTEEEDKREQERDERRRRERVSTSREELYQQVGGGAKLSRDFLLLVVLSTVVAAVGLINDNVAVVIGAMVIAPLLGPNLALAFAAAIGDREMIGRALVTGLAGLGIAIGLAALLPLFFEVDLANGELSGRTSVGFDAIALALASGAAAALSVSTGVSSVLVGVMVAAALLPPAATIGIALTDGQPMAAAGAALLLAVNLVSVNLAAVTVFLAKGLRPRTWFERQEAQQSLRVTLAVLICGLAVFTALIAISRSVPF
ncbi:MAG: TIGR00341 family protein [Pseudomonadota bacterium]